MASVQRRGDRWRVVVVAGRHPATGKRLQRVVTFDDEDTARAWAEMVDPSRPVPPQPTRARRCTYPTGPLEPHLRARCSALDDVIGPTRLLAELAGVSRHAGRLWRRQGWLAEHHADRVAVGLGMHPCEVWPSWFDDVALVDDVARVA